MQLIAKKRVTVVFEYALQSKVISNLKELGAETYTLTACQFEGKDGARIGDWDQNKNSQIDIICSESLAKTILNFVHETFEADYHVIAYINDIYVHPKGSLS